MAAWPEPSPERKGVLVLHTVITYVLIFAVHNRELENVEIQKKENPLLNIREVEEPWECFPRPFTLPQRVLGAQGDMTWDFSVHEGG